jgi:thiol-disulfide isomerase/thioredoxin
LCSAALLAACARLSEPNLGTYRAVLQLPGGELPFQLEVAREADTTVLYLTNGAERTRVSDVAIKNGSMSAKFPGLENRLAAKVSRDSLDGEVTMIRKGGEEQKLPFRAEHDKLYRFFANSASDNADVAGRWEVTFTEDDGKSYPAVAEFSQNQDRVTGTFLTGTGDHHFLDGQMRGDELFLSMFNGAHAFLYKGKIDASGNLTGEYWSGSHSHERFAAKRNSEATPPQEATTVRQDSLNFSFPDLEGKTVSLNDDRFRGRVVLVTLGGSWCGNCHDEAKFLAPFYAKYRDRGFEVVGLMFERFGDFPRAVEAATRFRKQFDIEYTMLIAGISDTDEASEKLPQLSHIYAFPTAALLDRHGKIRRIHTGFSGPATGAHYEDYKKEFTELVDQLLNEK